MRPLYNALAAMALILAACGPPDAASPAAAPAAGTGGLDAHGFITENPPLVTAAPPAADGVQRDAAGRPFQYALLGQALPAFTAPTSDGGTFSSADLTRWTVIDVWGAWCGDCVADGPYVAALERAISQDPDLDFVSLHTPANANRAVPDELYGRYGSLEAYFDAAGYEVASVVLDQDASVRDALQIRWTPSYLLVSPDGVVRGFRTDLRVIEDQPVKTFLQDVAKVRGEVAAGSGN